VLPLINADYVFEKLSQSTTYREHKSKVNDISYDEILVWQPTSQTNAIVILHNIKGGVINCYP